MSELDGRLVRHGLWTNWHEGAIMGKTITTDVRTGTVVVSLLAILASLAATHLWHIVTFSIHQIRAQGQNADGLYWQQQAILRTLPTPSSLMADNLNLWWNWKGRVRRSLLRCLFQIVLAMVFVSVTLTATITTSFIVSTSNVQVLVKSPYCGLINSTQEAMDLLKRGASRTYRTSIAITSSLYVDSCYDGADTPSSCRNTFVRSQVPFTTQRAECPFDSTMCVGSGSGDNLPAVALDTGLLSMSDVFGANFGKNNDVKFRKKLTCTVLPLKNRSEIVNTTEGISSNLDSLNKVPGTNDNIKSGVLKVYLGGFHNSTENATFTMDTAGKLILSNAALPNWPLSSGDWIPIPELSRKDADTSITLMALEEIMFSQPVEDPLMAAHQAKPGRVERTGTNFTAYKTDNAAGMLACTEQYQYCLARSSGKDFCTPLQAQPYSFNDEDFPAGSDFVQLSALKLLLEVQQQETMAMAIMHPMKINTRAEIRSPVPATYWVTEAKNWMEFTLTTWQVRFTDYAIGPILRDKELDMYVKPPSTQGQEDLCKIQKMRKQGGFANINHFGLVFTLTVSFAIIIIDITLLKILVFMSRFRKALAPRIDRWIQDGVLQLQRRAYEAQGYVRWEQVDQEVPITAKGVNLAELSQSKSYLLKREVTWEWNSSRHVGAGVVATATVGTAAVNSRDDRLRWSLS